MVQRDEGRSTDISKGRLSSFARDKPGPLPRPSAIKPAVEKGQERGRNRETFHVLLAVC